jgi:NADH-quinone oxidoreductase subunit G
MELGMIHRGEHSEITTMLGDTIDSELSGNMIDICPVGALTSKPFRYSARTWELSRRKSVSPHDSTGANLIVQVKSNKVMRVVPLENEAVNECWIADRDRFSYEAVNSEQRLLTPMLKQGGQWKAVDWTTALEYVANGLKQIVADHGPSSIGALGSPHSTVEELHLLAKLTRGLGSENIVHRLRHADFRRDGTAPGSARWLGTPIASLSELQRVLVVGSFLRKDHPLFAQRIRQAARRGAKVISLQAVHDDWLMPMAQRFTAAPSAWVQALADIATAVAQAQGAQAPAAGTATEAAQAAAATLLSGERKAVLLGNAAAQHPRAAELLALARFIGLHAGASVGFLGEAANSVGAQLVDALPGAGGLSAAQMLEHPRKALLLLNVEPVLDMANPQAAHAALQAAQMVVAFTSFKDAVVDGADVLLPIAPFTETAGTFVNAEGCAQSFHGVVKPLGETRPAWKVLRVLGNLLGLAGFAQESAEEVRAQALGDAAAIGARLSNAVDVRIDASHTAQGLERLADVPLYSTDALVRRASALQLSADARPPMASLPAALWHELGLREGDQVRIGQGSGHAVLPARLDATLAEGTVRVPAGHADTASLGAAFGPLAVTCVARREGAVA